MQQFKPHTSKWLEQQQLAACFPPVLAAVAMAAQAIATVMDRLSSISIGGLSGGAVLAASLCTALLAWTLAGLVSVCQSPAASRSIGAASMLMPHAVGWVCATPL